MHGSKLFKSDSRSKRLGYDNTEKDRERNLPCMHYLLSKRHSLLLGPSESQKNVPHTFLPELLEGGGMYLRIKSHYFLVVSYFGVLAPKITGLSHSGAEFALAMLEHSWAKPQAYHH